MELPSTAPVLVLGATGATGSRVVDRLRAAGVPVRAASRSGATRSTGPSRPPGGPRSPVPAPSTSSSRVAPARRLGSVHRPIAEGRNDHVSAGVERVLGRPPRDFDDVVRAAVADGTWPPFGS